MSKYAFDMSNEELLDDLVYAAAKAGSANSGGVFDVAGPMYVEEFKYLRGVVLSRLEGQTPPFRRGDTLTLKAKVQGRRVYAKDCKDHSTSKYLVEGESLTVYRMWYFGSGNWKVTFGRGTDCYDCDYFNPAVAE